ncbi:MAG: WecB/TagA/CpsF family glycosyltransferase [Planctomycetota bacterium]|jgi:N-acetylglucosaminyldiphosphoundecaprenol N-acetyl-beta-D-mannosaminyltransferase
MSSLPKVQTVNLLGIDVSAVRTKEVVGLCEKCIVKRSSLLLGVVNVAKAVKSRKDQQLRESLTEADIILADGVPIVWLSKLIGEPLPERVAGIDIMYRLLELSSKKNLRVYFLGAKQQVVQKVVKAITTEYPGVIVAGYRNGFFQESDDKEVAGLIRKSSADIIFVAMPSPKKEKFLKKWHDYMNVPVCHGVGGSFDIVAGVTKRAPSWMQKCGLEWLYRTIQEPRRMWKRYLFTNTVFIKLSLAAILSARVRQLFRSLPFKGISNARGHNI